MKRKKFLTYIFFIFSFLFLTISISLFFNYLQRGLNSSSPHSPDYQEGHWKEEEPPLPPLPHLLPPSRPPKQKKSPPKISSEEELEERLEIQRNWEKNFYPKLVADAEIKEKINSFLGTFYHQFLYEGLRDYEKAWQIPAVRPKKILGRTVVRATEDDIEYCKKIFPETKEAKIDWQGFGGFLRINSDKHGQCVSQIEERKLRNNKSTTKRSWAWTSKVDKETSCYCTYLRITIELSPLLFYKNNRHDDYWVIRKEKNYYGIIECWKELINTIAHELAHAIIRTLLHTNNNSELYGLDKKGHGPLHDDFTKRIKNMIKASPKYQKFWKWWNTPWTISSNYKDAMEQQSTEFKQS